MSEHHSNSQRITRLPQFSRRRVLSSLPALGGLLATGCSDAFTPPTIRGGLIGIADVLTMSTSRWLQADQPLAREYEPGDIAANFSHLGADQPVRRGLPAAAA